MQADAETPSILREIAQIWIDASSMSEKPAALPVLAERLRKMAVRQRAAGHDFYSAISLHNAGVAFFNSADYEAALSSASEALQAFDRLTFQAPERFSTHSVMALCHFELGSDRDAEDELALATSIGEEFADVPAELAIAFLARGERQRGIELISRAEVLEREGRSDVLGVAIKDAATALAKMSASPSDALEVLLDSEFDGPLDLGHPLARRSLLALAHFVAGRTEDSLAVAKPALHEARLRRARRAEVRLALLVALAERDPERIRLALTEAAAAGQLALGELADAVCASLDLLPATAPELEQAIETNPNRWRSALRRQLDRGDVPTGRAAARLLDRYGAFEDVGLLRAYAKTYRRRGVAPKLGVDLARRTSPRLQIHDLGKVSLTIGARSVALSGIRRKAATLLMYLLTRPSFTANRDQVLDELWPDADPSSSSNSLNQSLYFLRREIDPWYEDDVATDYVAVQGDLVWLDPALVSADSSEFFADARRLRLGGHLVDGTLDLIARYTGHFAPEFEYEEWAIGWRSRLRSALLDAAHSAIGASLRADRLEMARDVAIALLDVDPTATDIERRLIWLYWRLGATSAARAQYEHLARGEQADGLDPTPLEDIARASRPDMGE
jgi:DNA-binding SARP family transcriptional activator